MRSFRIFVNNIELPHIREDAKIHQENSSFYGDLKVSHNTRPIRITENEDTVKALGDYGINTAKKRKHFKCVVVKGAIRQNGILTQLGKEGDFRKCNIRFGSKVNHIMDKPIASFFPDFSVVGAENPAPYVNEAKEEFNCQDNWVAHANAVAGKIYPQVKWQFPEIRYRDKFGTDLKDGDPHFSYRGHINARDIDGLVKNSLLSNASYFVVRNSNVIAPQIFWLAPIAYAFESLGYKLIGSVPNHEFFKRLLILSDNDNMVKISKKPTGEPLDIAAGPWVTKTLSNIIDNAYITTYVKEIQFTPTQSGPHVVRYDMFVNSNNFGVQLLDGESLIAKKNSFYFADFEGTLNFTVPEVEAGDAFPTYTFIYHSIHKLIPDNFEIGWTPDLTELDFYDIHPTIEFARYIPDWSTADYLNKFQSLFNLKIDIDDIEKTIALNFNVEDYLLHGKIVPILKSLQISDPENIEAESYYLKYANNQDEAMFITQHEDVERDEFTKEIVTDFKHIPYDRGRSVLSQNVEDKDGVGLLIYDPATHPATVESYAGINLKIPGTGGIHETFHKPWLLFRLNASHAVLKGPFSKTELYQISKFKKLLVDNQIWMVKAIDYVEDVNGLFELEIKVASVSF